MLVGWPSPGLLGAHVDIGDGTHVRIGSGGTPILVVVLHLYKCNLLQLSGVQVFLLDRI